MTALDEVKIGGLGASRQRVEDARLIRGRGNFVDDVKLPGMLHMEILRSPLPHARIRSIDTSKAWKIPGVQLVLTGEMAAQRNLAWMPTLSYDTQAVLATDKVRFQGQEVACVVADDPYIAKDACEAIEVDYEPLPPIVNPEQALAADAPLIRDDKEGQTDNVCYRWEVGDADAHRRARSSRPTWSPSCGCTTRARTRRRSRTAASIADFNPATGKLTVYMTTQAPHIIRAAVALVAELPEHMIRIIAPDIGGGFGNKVPVYPGYVVLDPVLDPARQAGEVDRGQVRQPHLHRLRARHVPRRRAGAAARRQDPRRPHATSTADHGAFFSDAQPSKFKIGLLHSAFACYDIPAGHITAQGTYTNKAPGGVAYRCSFRVTEAMFFQERMVAGRGRGPRHGPGASSAASTCCATTSSPTARRSGSWSTPASTTSASTSAWRRSATTTSSGEGRGARRAAGSSASASRR